MGFKNLGMYAKKIWFGADGDISADNVQDAIVEVRDDTDTKLNALVNTSTGHDHDGTDSKKVDYTNLNSIPSSFTPASHGNEAHSSTFITSSGVTYENLSANGDIGTGSTQVSQGDHSHDGSYYTESEIDALFNTTTGHDHDGTDSKKVEYSNLNNIPSSFTPASHGNEAHSSTFITASGVTYENLSANGDIGTGSTQVSQGDHSHDSVYYTETEIDAMFNTTTGHDHDGTDSKKVEYSNLNNIPSSFTPASHGNEVHSSTFITASGVTYENLSANGDIGTGSTQVSQGDHNHDSVYYTETEINAMFNTSTGHDHDGTDSKKVDYTNLNSIPSSFTPASHGNEAHSSTFITASGVTYENLSANGDIGTASTQVSQGDHTHSTYLPLAGGNMTGDIDLDNNDIDDAKTIVFNGEVSNGDSSTSKTIDWTSGNKQYINFTADCTLTFTAPAGPTNLILRMNRDGDRNPTWPATVKWSGGTEPTWSTGSGAIDVASFYYDGTNYYGMAGIGFA